MTYTRLSKGIRRRLAVVSMTRYFPINSRCFVHECTDYFQIITNSLPTNVRNQRIPYETSKSHGCPFHLTRFLADPVCRLSKAYASPDKKGSETSFEDLQAHATVVIRAFPEARAVVGGVGGAVGLEAPVPFAVGADDVAADKRPFIVG